MAKKKILLVDDHCILRLGLTFLIKELLPDAIIFEASSIHDTLQLVQKNKFDFSVLDLQLIDGNIMDVLGDIFDAQPNMSTLIYSMYPEDFIGPRVIQLGAAGFLKKSSAREEVSIALKSLFTTGKYQSNQLLQTISKQKFTNPLTALSNRELSVFYHLIHGETLKQISNKFKLSPKTITTLKTRIYEKLNVKNLIELKEIADLYYHNHN